jgi:MOSC domain-containing protein YiiM
MTGKLIGIARVHELRAPLEELRTTNVTVEGGIDGDARGRKPGRQVTILFREGWEAACGELDVTLPWVTRRANLYVEGFAFPREIGWKLEIGHVLLEVTEETAPCMLMERAYTGLRQAMVPDWRGGVCTKVLKGGAFALGDAVRIA